MTMPPELKKLLKRLLLPFNIKLPAHINGKRFSIPVVRGVGASNLRITEKWAIDALHRLLSLRSGMAVVDVGVNIGQTLLKLKSIDPDIVYVGFEPNPFCFSYTQELIRINQFNHCEIIPVGLADQAGLISFIADSEADSAASIISDLRPGKAVHRFQHIAVFPFDQIASDVVPDNAGLVKIDVEGAELEVMTGMKNYLMTQRPWVTCEVLHAHSREQIGMLHERNSRLRRLLGELAYQPYRFLKDTDQNHIDGLEPVENFPDAIWNPHSSPAVCDYLFVPAEVREMTEQVFALSRG